MSASNVLDPSTAAPASDPSKPAPAPAASENFRKLPIGENDLNELTDLQRAALKMLLSGHRLIHIAKSLGITPRTLYTWRNHDVAFMAELTRGRESIWNESVDQVRALLPRAVEVMQQHLDDRYDRARFRAASTLLRLANLRSVIPVKTET
jgi:hypothetical protein